MSVQSICHLNNLLLWRRLTSNCEWSEVDVLKLAAGVESNTIHPIGKAIVEAARAVNCPSVKVFSDGRILLYFL